MHTWTADGNTDERPKLEMRALRPPLLLLQGPVVSRVRRPIMGTGRPEAAVEAANEKWVQNGTNSKLGLCRLSENVHQMVKFVRD